MLTILASTREQPATRLTAMVVKTMQRLDEFYLGPSDRIAASWMKGCTVAEVLACSNLGFLSVTREANGFVGGYLVTNAWGRPLEFRLSSAVQPNKVQAILYGDTLQSYLCGEVIGKTLVDKTTTPVQWILVDNPPALELRPHVSASVALWYAIADPDQPMPGLLVQSRMYCHVQFPDDVDVLRNQLEKLSHLDFSEPFARIREAMIEARKLGVTARGAAA